jgi:glycosyltransferase involved in cell wall biosynthesis
MNILYINTFDPYQETHGGSTVTRAELELLRTMGNVTTVFGLPLRKRKYQINYFRFIWDVLLGRSIKQASYNILHRPRNFYKNFDLIFCNHDFSAYDYRIFNALKKPFIVRKHNSEHKFFSAAGLLQRVERNRIKNFEGELGRLASSIIHISSSEFIDDDRSVNKYHLFPPLISDDLIAMPHSKGVYRHADRPIDILCVANYEWGPNKEGFDWFFSDVAPNLNTNFNIHLVGKGSNRYASQPSVTSYGYVEDVSIFYKSAKVFIAPVLSGAGIKIKNLEAMIYGVPIITTPLGVDGLTDISRVKGIAVAISPKSFAQELQSLLINEDRCGLQRNIAADWINSNILPTSHWRNQIIRLLNLAIST